MRTPNSTPRSRVVAVGAGLQRAGDQQHAGADERERDEDPALDRARRGSPRRRTGRSPPAGCRARSRGPAPTSPIAWCQKIRSAAKKTPAPAASALVAPRARAEAAVLQQRERAEQRERVGAAEDRRRRRRDVGELARGSRENAIVSAPATAASAGRSMIRATTGSGSRDARRRRGRAAVAVTRAPRCRPCRRARSRGARRCARRRRSLGGRGTRARRRAGARPATSRAVTSAAEPAAARARQRGDADDLAHARRRAGGCRWRARRPRPRRRRAASARGGCARSRKSSSTAERPTADASRSAGPASPARGARVRRSRCARPRRWPAAPGRRRRAGARSMPSRRLGRPEAPGAQHEQRRLEHLQPRRARDGEQRRARRSWTHSNASGSAERAHGARAPATTSSRVGAPRRRARAARSTASPAPP